MVITEAWAKLLYAAKVISERCNDGFLAASSRKGPSAINQLRNIGSHASFISRSHLECNKPTTAKSARHKRSNENWITKTREAQVSSLASRFFALLCVQFIPTLLESSNIYSL